MCTDSCLTAFPQPTYWHSILRPGVFWRFLLRNSVCPKYQRVSWMPNLWISRMWRVNFIGAELHNGHLVRLRIAPCVAASALMTKRGNGRCPELVLGAELWLATSSARLTRFNSGVSSPSSSSSSSSTFLTWSSSSSPSLSWTSATPGLIPWVHPSSSSSSRNR